MDSGLNGAQQIYDRLWINAIATLPKPGGVQVDRFLERPAADPRRGATLVARPAAEVRDRVETFLRKAAAICPNQYFYRPAELHVTVMAVIPGSEIWRQEIHRLPACKKALAGVLSKGRAFSLKFCGVTASPEAVLIQGFPQDDVLAQLRDELRNALREQGVGENLDRRYKIAAAHLTVMRFSNPRADWKQLLDFLQAHRETDFGETRIQSLQLIWGDWCASADSLRVLREYKLGS